MRATALLPIFGPCSTQRIRTGWKAVSRVFVLAIGMDIIYQIIALHSVYPGEALLVATGLAIVPYLLLRGPIDRMIQHGMRRKSAPR